MRLPDWLARLLGLYHPNGHVAQERSVHMNVLRRDQTYERLMRRMDAIKDAIDEDSRRG